MDVTTHARMVMNLGLNLVYAVVGLFIGILAMRLIDRFIFTDIDFIAELKKGNIAASIFYSVLLLFVALVVSASLN